MKTIEQWLTELETSATAGAESCSSRHAHDFLISGITRILCSCDRGVIRWEVDGRKADRQTAGQAIAHARARPHARFAFPR
jgi:hypothetical protein